jgi:hypothetical protein
MTTRYFTLDEANHLLSEIRPLVRKILAIRAGLIAQRPEIWPIIEKAAGNGGSQTASQVTGEFDKLDAAVHAIQDHGVLVKDINTGLLDFPHLLDGREVYLCWRYDESEILYWHETNVGFDGRQPL